MKLWKRSI